MSCPYYENNAFTLGKFGLNWSCFSKNIRGFYVDKRPVNYLDQVQILRFVAATAVLFAHLQHEVVARFPHQAGFKPFSLIDGGLGVDIFFVISGFIMHHVTAGKFGSPSASKEFLIRRVVRIAPLYYIASLFMILATFIYPSDVSISELNLVHILTSFLFFPSLNDIGQIAPVLKLGWTLNFEIYFYAVYALALAFSRRAGLLFLTLVLGAVLVLAQVLPNPPVAVDFWGQSLVLEFLGGIAAAALYARGFRINRSTAWIVIVVSLLSLGMMRHEDIVSSLPRGVYAGLPALLIVIAVVSAPIGTGMGRVKRFLIAGGEASYAIYVIHPFGIRAGALIWLELGLPVQPWIYIVVLSGLVVASAFAVHLLVEKPLDRWLRSSRVFSGKSGRTVSVGAGKAAAS